MVAMLLGDMSFVKSNHSQESWWTFTITERLRDVIWSMTVETRVSHVASTVYDGAGPILVVHVTVFDVRSLLIVREWKFVPGSLTPLKPAALISSNVFSSTGGLFHFPSPPTASKVLPRFQPMRY